jgi:signal peptidase I
VIAIGVAVLIKTFVVQPFYIPSQSMEQTLHGCPTCSGDRILVNKPIYHLRSQHPGDIVVFKAPTDEWFNEPFPSPPSNPVAKAIRTFGQLVGVIPPDEHDLVKRVIAVGGQTIKCCDAQGNIQVSDTGPNGPWRTLHENYIYDPLSPTAGAFGPVTVPKGRLWVMGDNRSDSEDSRWHYVNDYRGDVTLSTVPTNDVIGKAFVIAWPPSRWRTLGTPGTFTSAQALGSGVLPIGGAALVVVLPVGLVRRRGRAGSGRLRRRAGFERPRRGAGFERLRRGAGFERLRRRAGFERLRRRAGFERLRRRAGFERLRRGAGFERLRRRKR